MHTAARLVVINVTGIAEERGFRLFWSDERFRVVDEGYATSSPFRRESAARAYAARKYPGIKVTRERA